MPRLLTVSAFGALALATVTIAAADWSPEAAARYLDERQKQWFEWKPAASANGPCVSCHTGMTYLLARPVLRRVMKEAQPTVCEKGLLDRLRFEAPAKGAWKWYSANLDPWEHAESSYFGASLAMLALGSTPADYQQRAETRQHVAALASYLATSSERPLHDRIALLWASSTSPAALTDAARAALVAEVFAKQQADGGWSLSSLGPWTPHPDAPPASGSDAYATAFTAFALGKGGIAPSHPGFSRALSWLKARQDPSTGAWAAVSMNKRRPAGSMEALFMQDAATAFAAIALIDATER